MKRLFDFLQSVAPEFYSLLGFPTIKISCDVAEVYFDCTSVVRDLSVLCVDCDSFRMFGGSDSITLVYCFNLDIND